MRESFLPELHGRSDKDDQQAIATPSTVGNAHQRFGSQWSKSWGEERRVTESESAMSEVAGRDAGRDSDGLQRTHMPTGTSMLVSASESSSSSSSSSDPESEPEQETTGKGEVSLHASRHGSNNMALASRRGVNRTRTELRTLAARAAAALPLAVVVLDEAVWPISDELPQPAARPTTASSAASASAATNAPLCRSATGRASARLCWLAHPVWRLL